MASYVYVEWAAHGLVIASNNSEPPNFHYDGDLLERNTHLDCFELGNPIVDCLSAPAIMILVGLHCSDVGLAYEDCQAAEIVEHC